MENQISGTLSTGRKGENEVEWTLDVSPWVTMLSTVDEKYKGLAEQNFAYSIAHLRVKFNQTVSKRYTEKEITAEQVRTAAKDFQIPTLGVSSISLEDLQKLVDTAKARLLKKQNADGNGTVVKNRVVGKK